MTPSLSGTDDEGSTLRVDPGGDDPDAFETIQAAVDAAHPGDLVIVEEAVYEEHVVIQTAEITLQTFADATLSGSEERPVGFEVLASGVSISGFHLEGFEQAAILATGDGGDELHVESNTIRDSNGIAVAVHQGENARVIGNHIHDVRVGVRLEETRNAAVQDNRITDTAAEGVHVGPEPTTDLFEVVGDVVDSVPGQEDAVDLLFDVIDEVPTVNFPPSLQRPDAALLTQSTRDDDAFTSVGNTVTGNHVARCGTGILLQDTRADRVEGNHVEACWRGLEADAARQPEIHNNILLDNEELGLFLSATSSATLTGNRMDENGYGMDVVGSYVHEIDTSNTVHGAPVHYFTNEAGLTIEGPLETGFLAVVDSVDVTIRDLNVSGLRTGPMLVGVQGGTLERLDLSGNADGMRLVQTSFVELRDSHIHGNQNGLVVAQNMDLSRGLSVKNTTFEANGHGVDLFFSAVHATFEGNTFKNNTISGIAAFLLQATTARDLHIVDNRFENNGPTTGGGARAGNIAIMNHPGNALIAGNHISGGSAGITVRFAAPGLKIMDNTIRDTRTTGIDLTNNNGLVLLDNDVHGNEVGLEFWGGEANVLRDNRLHDNGYNLYMRFFTNLQTPNIPGAHSIDTSNTVDGRPVHYHYGEPVVTIDASDDPGYVAVIGAQHVTVRDVDLSGNGQGIALSHVENAVVENVTIRDTLQGIQMIEAHNVQVTGSDITSSATAPDRGIGLQAVRSGAVTIEGNTFSEALHGVRLSSSEDVVVRGNLFKGNKVPQLDGSVEGNGIHVFFSDEILIEQNSFIENHNGIHLNCCPMTNGGNLATVQNNHVANNNDGIVLQMYRDEAVVHDNLITDNERGIVVTEYFPQAFAGRMGKPEITGNTIAGNREYGIHNLVTGTDNIVDATGNHWGSGTGPSSPRGTMLEDPFTGEKANGNGDCVSQGPEDGVSNVAFDPYLGDPGQPMKRSAGARDGNLPC